MTYRLDTQADLARAVKKLAQRDARLKAILAQTGMPALRRRPSGFAGLAMIVVGQQLSTASAGAVWARLSSAFKPFHPASLGRARKERLSTLGLSAAKIKTLKIIAREIKEDRLDLEALAALDAKDAHQLLTSLHGVGPWTADVYLLFCLGHGDAWPAGDLALQEAVRSGLGLTARPTGRQLDSIAENWRPLRGAAAHLWWAYYKTMKKREDVPVALA